MKRIEEKNSLEKVGINDVEKMIRLADDVLRQIEMNNYLYDEEGKSLLRLVEERGGEFEEFDAMTKDPKHKERCEKMRRFIYDNIREKKEFYEVYDEPAAVLVKKLEPYKKCILGIFRNGAVQDTVTNETNYCADESVDDDYLMELLAMRLRDRKIIIAVQRSNND